MALTIKFYKMHKKVNSTKRPTNDDLKATYNCLLKDGSSVFSPTFEIADSSFDVKDTNYCYIQAYDRYYYVREFTWSNGMWIVSLQEDALASWKVTIGNSEQYVVRSSHEKDGNIIDNFYPAKKTYTYNALSFGFNDSADTLNNGTYVIGIVNKNSNTVGSVAYYAMSNSQFGSFKNYFLNESNYSFTTNFEKALFNPFQYVVSCMWFPFTISGTDTHYIDFGWYQYHDNENVIAKRFSNTYPAKYHTGSVAVTKHPLAATRGNYMNTSLFTRYELVYKPYGRIPLDPIIISNFDTITAYELIDYTTGIGHLYLGDSTGAKIYYDAETQIGVPIQLSQIYRNIVSGLIRDVQTGATAVLSAATGSNPGTILNNGITGIASTISALLPQRESISTNGSLSKLLSLNNVERNDCYLYAQFLDMAQDDNDSKGRPLCKVKTINTIPGYIQCSDIHLAIPGTREEQDEIISIMEGGFFYE